MRAKFHGMEVEGTPEEILKVKDELDRREEVKHNFKIVFHTAPIVGDVINDIENHIMKFMKRYPNDTCI